MSKEKKDKDIFKLNFTKGKKFEADENGFISKKMLYDSLSNTEKRIFEITIKLNLYNPTMKTKEKLVKYALREALKHRNDNEHIKFEEKTLDEIVKEIESDEN